MALDMTPLRLTDMPFRLDAVLFRVDLLLIAFGMTFLLTMSKLIYFSPFLPGVCIDWSSIKLGSSNTVNARLVFLSLINSLSLFFCYWSIFALYSSRYRYGSTEWPSWLDSPLEAWIVGEGGRWITLDSFLNIIGWLPLSPIIPPSSHSLSESCFNFSCASI